MTSRESFGIAKAVINKLLPYLSSNAQEASAFFSHDATLIFMQDKEQISLTGKHSIFNFLNRIPLFRYEVSSYDTHTIVIEGISLTLLVITGTISFVPKEKKQGIPEKEKYPRFHISAHIQECDGGRFAVVKTMTFKIQTQP